MFSHQSSIPYSLGLLRLNPPCAKPVLTQQAQLAESNGNRQVGRKGLWKTRRLSEPNAVVVCDWDFPSLGGMKKSSPLVMPTSPISSSLHRPISPLFLPQPSMLVPAWASEMRVGGEGERERGTEKEREHEHCREGGA